MLGTLVKHMHKHTSTKQKPQRPISSQLWAAECGGEKGRAGPSITPTAALFPGLQGQLATGTWLGRFTRLRFLIYRPSVPFGCVGMQDYSTLGLKSKTVLRTVQTDISTTCLNFCHNTM